MPSEIMALSKRERAFLYAAINEYQKKLPKKQGGDSLDSEGTKISVLEAISPVVEEIYKNTMLIADYSNVWADNFSEKNFNSEMFGSDFSYEGMSDILGSGMEQGAFGGISDEVSGVTGQVQELFYAFENGYGIADYGLASISVPPEVLLKRLED